MTDQVLENATVEVTEFGLQFHSDAGNALILMDQAGALDAYRVLAGYPSEREWLLEHILAVIILNAGGKLVLGASPDVSKLKPIKMTDMPDGSLELTMES